MSWFLKPLLFQTGHLAPPLRVGAAIKFANLSPATIPRSMLLIFIGLCVRLPAVGGCTS
jgi:hypothetical protein